MIKFNELQQGCYVMAQYEERTVQGEVTELKRDQKLACINDGVQDFWFDADHLQPIPITHNELLKLNFTFQLNDDGTVKYSKGAFRIQLQAANQFTNYEIWYREDKRKIHQLIHIHELQNLYNDMTKVYLTSEAF